MQNKELKNFIDRLSQKIENSSIQTYLGKAALDEADFALHITGDIDAARRAVEMAEDIIGMPKFKPFI